MLSWKKFGEHLHAFHRWATWDGLSPSDYYLNSVNEPMKEYAMSVNTKIQWCDSTCNPTMGCDGCELWSKAVRKCYAGILHTRFGGVTAGYAPTFENVTLFPDRMRAAAHWSDLTGKPRADKPWLNGYPRLIFVSDMSDALSLAVPFSYLRNEVIENVVSEAGRRHCWLWLTKRPERMAKFSTWLVGEGANWPSNLWAGTSVTSQVTTGRINHLMGVGDKSTIRFLSVEPQYEALDLAAWLPKLDWIIQGGESGHRARNFDLSWTASLIEQCRTHGVAYFLKQLGARVTRNGEPLHFEDGHAGNWEEWPKKIRVRQLPKLKHVSVPRSNHLSRSRNATPASRRQAALKAWATRRAKSAENPTTSERRQAALKA